VTFHLLVLGVEGTCWNYCCYYWCCCYCSEGYAFAVPEVNQPQVVCNVENVVSAGGNLYEEEGEASGGGKDQEDPSGARNSETHFANCSVQAKSCMYMMTCNDEINPSKSALEAFIPQTSA